MAGMHAPPSEPVDRRRDATAHLPHRLRPITLRHVPVLAVLATLSFLSGMNPVGAAELPVNASYTTIDYPGASGTVVNAVNRVSLNGPSEVVGTFLDIQGVHGFLFSGGHYTKLDVPGGHSTTALGINARHEIVGTFVTAGGQPCSYKYSQGTYSSILNACVFGSQSFSVRGINGTGTLVGVTGSSAHSVGFMQRPNVFGAETRKVPGAEKTELHGINNGVISRMVGSYTTADGHRHGALFTSNSSTADTFDYHPQAVRTEVNAVNDAGQIAGYFADPIGKGFVSHGFVRDRQGDRRIDYPGARNTKVNGVNNPDLLGRFNVVGSYDAGTAGSFSHGFFATIAPTSTTDP